MPEKNYTTIRKNWINKCRKIKNDDVPGPGRWERGGGLKTCLIAVALNGNKFLD
jgi:hypothetical protein